MKKLNLGAGSSVIDGYEPRDGAKGDCLYPLPDPDGTVDEIRASHVLEHFGHREIPQILKDWVRALKPGGLLKIAVPDLKVIANLYVAGQNVNVQGYLMGGQTDALDFHKCLFDRDLLTSFMQAAGLSGVRGWTSEIQDCASLPISLNLAGVKEAGASEPMQVGLDAAFERGIGQMQAGRLDEALASFDELLAAQPNHAGALNNRGIILARLRRHSEALDSFDRALGLNPEFPEALRNRGSALAESGRRDEALGSYIRAVQVKPDFADGWFGLGLLLQDLGRHEDALQSFDRALAIDASNAGVLAKRASSLAILRRYDDALAAFERCFATASASATALNECGLVLMNLRRPQEALAYFDRAVAAKPGFVEALSNRGLALGKLMRFKEGLAALDDALREKPDHVPALDNRAVALAKLGRFQESLDCHEDALRIRPDFPNAHVNQGITRLRLGDFQRGLPSYEWRWTDLDNGRHWKDFAQPLWTGREPLEGKTILLHAEQGLGDTLQFVRYAQIVAAKGAKVWLAVPAQLAPLMRSLKGVEKVLRYGEAVPATDFHCPLLSVPLMLGTTVETIPATVPYLFIDTARAKQARLKLAQRGRRLVGICWRGNPLYQEDNERSIPFEAIRPLLSVKGVQFVSLQKELTEKEQSAAEALGLVHPGADFETTCDIVAALDLVISVDTSWAHFSGAIGKPVWMLLAPVPHWVWLTGRNDSPWYPSARLFRQAIAGDWGAVMNAVAEELSVKRRSKGRTSA